MTLLQRIHISQLRIDPLCQRAVDERRAKAMSLVFDIDAVGALIVNLREDGFYYVIDGGHRLCGARMAGYDGKLPCVVHEHLPRDREAQLFLLHNDSKLVQAIDKFRMHVLARHSDQVAIDDLLHMYGWTATTGGSTGSFAAVAAAQKVYAGAGIVEGPRKDLLEQTLLCITTAWGNNPAGAHAAIVGGMGQLFARYGNGVDMGKLTDEMAKLRPVDAVTKAKSIKDSQGGTIPAAMAKVLVGLHNRSRRVNRLPDWRWTR